MGPIRMDCVSRLFVNTLCYLFIIYLFVCVRNLSAMYAGLWWIAIEGLLGIG